MSAVSSRDKNILMVVMVVVLYIVAAVTAKKQIPNWTKARRISQAAQKKLAEESDLIAARDAWAERYAKMRDLMPVFPYDKDVDTHWLNIMDSAATRNGLTISRRQTSKEAEVGDVYELPIECKDWEGSLESLVKFLYDLNSEGAMLDVRQLYIRPSSKPGYLKGTFTLYCAYMRGDVEKAAAAAPAPESPAVQPLPEAAASEMLSADPEPVASEPAPEPAAPEPIPAPAPEPATPEPAPAP